MGFDNALGRICGVTDHAYLALTHEVGERADGLFEVDPLVRSMHLVEVDVVGVETAQTVFDRFHDPQS